MWWLVITDLTTIYPPPPQFRTDVPVAYPQGKRDHCLFLCLASALHYMGMEEEAEDLSEWAFKASETSGSVGIQLLKSFMKASAPSIAIPTIFNVSHKKRKRPMNPKDLMNFTPYPTVIIPQGADGSISHAVCVIDDLIFDTSQPYALKCSIGSMGWICNCGPHAFVEIFEAFRFERGHRCTTLKRKVTLNWKKPTEKQKKTKK